MADDFSIQGTVAIRIRSGPDIHLHTAGNTVRERKKISVVVATSVLSISQDRIASRTTASKVADLEITRSFGKTQFIQLVVHDVVPIKQVHNCSGRIS